MEEKATKKVIQQLVETMAKKTTDKVIQELLEDELATSESVKFLTYYAGTYYFLLLNGKEPVGVVEFYEFSEDRVVYHNFKIIEGMITPRLIEKFVKVEKQLGELKWNKKHLEI